MHTSRKILLGGAVILALSGCSDPTGPATPLVTGAWTMSLYSDGLVVPGEFDLIESAGKVSGTGSIEADGSPYVFTVSGEHTYPTVKLKVASEQFSDMTFSGAFKSDDMIEGTVLGSGFTGQRMVFHRQ